YYNTGQIEKAIQPYEESIRLNPKDRLSYWNLIEALDRLGKCEDRELWSEQALPYFERRIILIPDDQFARAQYATLLLYVGQKDAAMVTIQPLLTSKEVDGFALYTISVLFLHV